MANKLVQVYDDEGKNILARRLINEKVTNISFGSDVKKIYVHTINKLRTVGGLPEVIQMRHSGQLLDVKISKDNKYVATASHDHYARSWDAATGNLLVPPLRHKEQSVSFVNFSPCGNWLITVGRDSDKLNVWDVKSGKRLPMEFSVPGEKITSAEFSPCGKYIITGTHLLTAYIWNFKEEKQAFPELSHSSSIVAAKFSNDGKSLLITSPGSSARLFSADNLKKQIVSVAPSTYFPLGEITPDDKYIITIFENQIRVSDAHDGYLKYEPIEFPDQVFKAVLSPDGNYIAAFNLGEGKAKSQVRCYDVESGKEVFSPIFFDYKLYDAHITHCSKYIILNGDVNQVWDITTGKPASVPEPYSQFRLKTGFRHNSNEFIILKNNTLYLDRFFTYQEILDHYRNNRQM